MKTIKQIITVIALAMFMFSSYSGNAQTKIEFPPKGNSTVLIPDEYKSSREINSKDVVFFSKFSKKVNGFVTIAYDMDFKLVSVTAPRSVSKNKLVNSNNEKGEMADCVKDCGSTWVCGAACLWDWVEDKF